ncbi:endonuclease domain-containing 1 protein-like [Manis pentadactyla]|uniref:endonuclease domain-containing 1 protein-like n=1 Tax=Manis pentadactyla TaxID=143292 RepID=UPI00255C4FA0|nr:endonuclease domain-containing 1 protein-like [Manis pentadactyla]
MSGTRPAAAGWRRASAAICRARGREARPRDADPPPRPGRPAGLLRALAARAGLASDSPAPGPADSRSPPGPAAMGPARWLALGGLFALAGLPEGRLVREQEAGFGECDRFFYAERPPAGLAAGAHVKICQRSEGAERFATLYSTRDRIPVYSALRGVRPAAEGAAPRWLLEPQIDDPNSHLEEVTEEADAIASVNNLGSKQALNTDYLDSGYQRGQLYPFSLSSDLQMATFTLTNAAPMTPTFRERWYMNLNSLMERALSPQCGSGEDLYIITGAVPSDRKVKDKVAIPEFVWLAACCAVPGGGWAMGFVKHTRDGDIIEDVMVKELEKLLPFNPQLFLNNCGETEQDTEKMKKILEMVNQVQDEERMAQSAEGSSPLSGTRSEGLALPPAEAPADGSGFWGKLMGFIATPFIKLFQLVYYLAVGILKNAVYFLWYVTKQVIKGIKSCLYRLGSATISYFMAIGEELVSIPWKVLRVTAKVIRAILRILCCLMKAICRILGVPVRVLVDVAAFPMYTVGAIPTVCKDIAVGLGGTLSLLFDTAFGTMGGLLQVVFSVCKSIGYKVTFDNSGEL